MAKITHKSRLNRKSNEAHRQEAARKQQPVPIEEQQRRAEERRLAHEWRYPTPPVYDPWVSVGSWRPWHQQETE